MDAMGTYSAEAVDLLADVDYGEGWISFRWPDPLYGHEELTVDLDGHCSRAMPMYSGSGLEAVELHRDRVRFRFSESLARKLRFEKYIEIAFSISDDEFHKLRAAIDFIVGASDCNS